MSNQISLHSYFHDAHYFKAALQIYDFKGKGHDAWPSMVLCISPTHREHKPGAVVCYEHQLWF